MVEIQAQGCLAGYWPSCYGAKSTRHGFPADRPFVVANAQQRLHSDPPAHLSSSVETTKIALEQAS